MASNPTPGPLSGWPDAAAPGAPADLSGGPAPGPGAPRRKVGFFAHQLVEYVIGAALIAGGVRVTGDETALLIGLGIVIMVLAALSDGPLGATHLIGRRLHHVLDLVVAGLAALSPLLTLRHPNVGLIALSELVALVLIRVERGTSYAYGPARSAATASGKGAAPSQVGTPVAARQPTAGLARRVPPAAGLLARSESGAGPATGDGDGWIPGVTGGGALTGGGGSVTGAVPAAGAAGAVVGAGTVAGGPAASPGAPAADGADWASAARTGAVAARTGAAAASAVAAQLAPVASRAAHRGAYHLGLVTGVARRVNRERKVVAQRGDGAQQAESGDRTGNLGAPPGGFEGD